MQSYLDQWAQEQDHSGRTGPFDPAGRSKEERGRLHLSAAEVHWLANQSEFDEFYRVSNLHLEEVDLSGAHLERADLTGRRWVSDDAQEELLSFEEFRARIGFSPQRVRSALMALQLSPVTRPGDMRRLFYLGSWVQPIQDYLAANGARRLA